MHGPFSLVLLFFWALISLASLPAQEPSAALAYFRIVNATGESENLMIYLNNEVLNPSGLASGKATGGLGIVPGMLSFKATHSVLGESEFKLDAKPGTLTAVIFRPKVEDRKDGKPPKVTLVHQLLNAMPSSKSSSHTLTLLQSTNVPLLEITLGTSAYSLELDKPVILPSPKAQGLFPRLKFRNSSLGSVNLESPEDRVVVFFTDREGVLKTVQFGNAVN